MIEIVVIVILILIVIYCCRIIGGLNARLDDRNQIISVICLKYQIPIEEVIELSGFQDDITVAENE